MKYERSDGDMIKFEAIFYAAVWSQELGMSCNETHAPVVKWITNRTFLALSIISNWKTRAIDFDEACTQADCEADTCLHLPEVFKVNSSQRYDMKLLKTSVDLSKRDATFCEKLYLELSSPKGYFIQSQSNPCMFHKKDMTLL